MSDLTLTPNRVSSAIDALRPRTAELTPEKYNELSLAMNIEPDEHFAYQQAQSRAHADGKITADEALIVYAALGENQTTGNGGWTTGTDLATKVIVTKLVGELLKARIG